MIFNNGKNRLQAILPVVVFLLFTLLSPVFAQVQKDVNGSEGMAATAHPLATRAALEMMAKGGNAVDAAVAAAFAIGVVEPDGSGLGGGGGMVISLAGQNKNIFINYYQCASENVEKLAFDFDKDKKTAKSILVPGTVAGLLTALEKFGTLPIATILRPAISYARDGFPVDETLSKIILDNSEVLQKYPATSAIFLPEGFPVGQGDTLRQPLLAETLELIAQHGKSGFYEGPVAEQMVKDVTENGGMLTLNDLKNYQAVVSEPLVGKFRGYKILTSPPPLSGASVIEALNIFELGDLAGWGHFSTSDKSLHFLAETFKRVSADRSMSLGDPLYGNIPVKGIISKAFARDRYSTIDFGQVNPPENKQVKAGNASKYNTDAPPAPKAGKFEQAQPDTEVKEDADDQDDEVMPSSKSWKNDKFDNWGKKKQKFNSAPVRVVVPSDTTDKVDDKDRMESQLYYKMSDEQYAVLAEASGEGGHTTHLSIADKAGNMVALTQTLGNFFGSGLSSAGVLFNNGLVNFSAVSEKNRIQPGKRPRSSISPTIILDKDDKPYIALGSPGAGRIIPTVTQIILNLLEYKMNITDANNAPRMYSQKFDEKLYLEGRVPVEVREALAKKGHQIQVYDDFDLYFGGAQIVEYDSQTGRFYGSADKRRGGSAGGGD
jgi:gamma-glutamyltranspeptidase